MPLRHLQSDLIFANSARGCAGERPAPSRSANGSVSPQAISPSSVSCRMGTYVPCPGIDLVNGARTPVRCSRSSALLSSSPLGFVPLDTPAVSSGGSGTPRACHRLGRSRSFLNLQRHVPGMVAPARRLSRSPHTDRIVTLRFTPSLGSAVSRLSSMRANRISSVVPLDAHPVRWAQSRCVTCARANTALSRSESSNPDCGRESAKPRPGQSLTVLSVSQPAVPFQGIGGEVGPKEERR